MKFKVNREKLSKALQKVGGLTGSRNIMPLLNNVLLRAEDNMLYLTTSDLEMRMNTSIEAEVQEPGITTVPSKQLSSLTSSMNGADVEFTVDDGDHINIICGTGKFRLLGLPGADYPVENEFTPQREVRIRESEFKSLINSVSYAVSQDASRKALTGVFFNIVDGTLALVATDGKRLAMHEKTPESVTGDNGSAIVPLKAVAKVSSMLEGDGTLKIAIGDKFCSFETAGFSMSSKLIEGNYPNYRSVVPTSFEQIIVLPVEPLLSKVETVSLMLPDATFSVVLKFGDNRVNIEAVSSELGEGSDFVEVQFEGEPFEVSFNPHFLIAPLKNTGAETIKFKLNDPLNPVAFEAEEGFVNVIMPIRKKAPAAPQQ
ncbi:MAG: DNA polymerase III subunit beta [Lentisphaeria bacterium]|nr:DNA polymerase III subunit beta [Lentisphaeria bacterium]